MLWYFNLFLQKSWFSKTNNCSFCNETTQDFAEFWEIWRNFKAKTKTEDEGILRKGKRSSSWFFSLHIGLAEREENQIFCHTKHANKELNLKTASKDFRVDVLICHLAGHQTRHTVDVLSVNEKELFLHSYLNQHGRLCSQLVACRCAGIAMRLGSGRNWVGWGCV